MADTIELNIEDNGKELKFRIKTMDAYKAESWLIRAGLLLGREFSSLVNLKDAKALLHALCGVKYEEAKPLLDELLGCCYFCTDKFEKRMTDDGAKGMVTSPMTLLRLRIESVKANFSFLLDGNLLNSLTDSATKQSAKK